MPLLIYLEDSGDKEEEPNEFLSNSTSAETTPEPGSQSKKPTEEPTSEPDSYALS